jgi:hypothetical protein
MQNEIGDQEDKEDFQRSGENSLGQEGLERCGCRSMPPGGQKVKKKKPGELPHFILVRRIFISFIVVNIYLHI